jgi:hypothetical protein
MVDHRQSRIQELERLRAELVQAGQLLDELERRHQAQRPKKASADRALEIDPIDTETRFAACVSHALAKLSAG